MSLDSVISPDYVKVIENKGMPVYNEDPLMPIKRDFTRGKLILKFDINDNIRPVEELKSIFRTYNKFWFLNYRIYTKHSTIINIKRNINNIFSVTIMITTLFC